MPMCTSSARKKDAGVSFHEIPADLELRQRWLKVISRKNWEPKTTSNYSVICSKHFLTSDFRENTKIRQLNKGAVPSVFPCYPSYMKPTLAKIRSDVSSRKRAVQLDCGQEKASKKRGVETAACFDDTRPIGDNEDPGCPGAASVAVARPALAPSPANRPTCSNASLTLSDTVCAVATAVHTEALTDRTAAFAKRTFSTQTDRATSSSSFVDRRKQRARERALRLQIVRLQQTVERYKEELRKLKEDCSVSAFVDVVADAHQNKAKAVFIVDQVTNYGKKRPTWSETTVRYCVILRNLSTKAYEYVRSEHLRLPCRNTLQKYIGSVTGEIGFSPLVHYRLKIELQGLPTSQSKVCSLVVDEMHIKQKLEYNKQRDAFIADVSMSVYLKHLIPSDSD